ncbi:rbcL [Symbiodinium natans]|uniref:RbcL protein n=1 Tax=Symbiodinium natans TaxID=878477 RepID=A0A812R885_9DINO|nr:rbcL [Symbiodinium natans]
MRACVKETGACKLLSTCTTADEPKEMIARGKYLLSELGPLSENCAYLVDGYRRNFPARHHRFGHGFVMTSHASETSPQTQHGFAAFVQTKITPGIRTGLNRTKMEGVGADNKALTVFSMIENLCVKS